MTQRVEPVRRADHARNRRHLANSQVARLFREVVLRRLPHTVYPFLPALPKIDIVNIVFQDFIFRVSAFGDIRHQRLFDLALVTALAGQEKIFHELLGKRRAALANVARSEIDIARLEGADQIDSMMLVEAMILGAQNRVDQRRGYLAEANQPALLPCALEDAADQFGLQLRRVYLLTGSAILHRHDRVALERDIDNLAAEVAIRIREAVQEHLELAAFLVVAIFAARPDFAGIDGMIVEAREPLEESEIVQILTGIDEHRVGKDTRRT